MWGGYTDQGAWAQAFTSNLWAPYNVQKALTGSDQPELRKWHFNAISNYTFDRGALKGFNAGGAFRWEDRPTLGFGIHNAQITPDSKLWIADVNQPLKGPADKHFDLWVGYEHKLSSKVHWRLQLNLRNVGEKVRLVPITLLPDGSVAQSRIQEGTTYELSSKFSF
jgi:hypothetical protein